MLISTQNRPSSQIGNYCLLWDRENPYLKLQPLKLEVLLEEPLIHIYHDVVSDKDIEEMKHQAKTQVGLSCQRDCSNINMKYHVEQYVQ